MTFLLQKQINCSRIIKGDKMDEIVDLLDDSGNIIGTQSKNVAHKTGAWHKSVHIYLINNKDEILLQFRSANKNIYPNIWDISVGGHVGAGEDTKSVACRELQEELGISCDPEDLTFLTTTKEILKTGEYISSEFVDSFFLCKNITELDIKIQQSELSDIKFIKFCDFVQMVKNKDKILFPHYEEYSKVIPILNSIRR